MALRLPTSSLRPLYLLWSPEISLSGVCADHLFSFLVPVTIGVCSLDTLAVSLMAGTPVAPCHRQTSQRVGMYVVWGLQGLEAVIAVRAKLVLFASACVVAPGHLRQQLVNETIGI